MINNKWINVSRIEEIILRDNHCVIKCMANNPMTLECDSEELFELLDHGYIE